MNFRVEGIFPALLTPFTKGGKSIDFEKAIALAERLAKQGVHGIFPCGTTGEGMLQSVAERKQLIAELVKAVGKKLKVIAHTGAFDTATAIELTEHAHEVGAFAAGVVTPGFHGYDNAALKTHYVAVAKSVPKFPILLYNIPGCARNAISPGLVFDLAEECDNVVGMKDSGGSIVNLNAVLMGAPKNFSVINGVDEYTYQAYCAGAAGSVSSTANVVPELFLGIYKAVKEGNHKQALKVQHQLTQACGMFQYGAMVGYYKEALRIRGFDPGYVRPPQRELTKDERKALEKGMKKAGLV